MSDSNKPHKTLGREAADFVVALHERGTLVFRIGDVEALAGLSPASARSFARTLVDRGVAARLTPGLFVLVPFELGAERQYLGEPLVVARELMAGHDYYVSHGSAMEHHHMLTQPQLVFTVSTPARRRSLTILGSEFRFVHCPPRRMWGFGSMWVTKQERVAISDLERTIVDGLRLPAYCGGVSEVARGLWLRRADIDMGRLVDYALRLDVGAVVRRLGLLLEIYELAGPAQLERLRDTLTSTYARLDPLLPAEGRRLRRWRLQLNLATDELRSVITT
jgi:predicted transcriptional regulator of viral defense system